MIDNIPTTLRLSQPRNVGLFIGFLRVINSNSLLNLSSSISAQSWALLAPSQSPQMSRVSCLSQRERMMLLMLHEGMLLCRRTHDTWRRCPVKERCCVRGLNWFVCREAHQLGTALGESLQPHTVP